jgi:hypothetical protein
MAPSSGSTHPEARGISFVRRVGLRCSPCRSRVLDHKQRDAPLACPGVSARSKTSESEIQPPAKGGSTSNWAAGGNGVARSRTATESRRKLQAGRTLPKASPCRSAITFSASPTVAPWPTSTFSLSRPAAARAAAKYRTVTTVKPPIALFRGSTNPTSVWLYDDVVASTSGLGKPVYRRITLIVFGYAELCPMISAHAEQRLS